MIGYNAAKFAETCISGEMAHLILPLASPARGSTRRTPSTRGSRVTSLRGRRFGDFTVDRGRLGEEFLMGWVCGKVPVRCLAVLSICHTV